MRTLAGNAPGQVDPDQKSRIFRSESAVLAFATFDLVAGPATLGPEANAIPGLLEYLSKKRLAVEVHPSGDFIWRFVPDAQLCDGVEDEGPWPRIVDLCGELVYMYRDQWDIYKLDPAYECIVHEFSQPSVITLASIKREVPSPMPDASNFSIPRPPRTPKRYFEKRPTKLPSRMVVLGVSMTKVRRMPSYENFSDETDESDAESEDMKVDTRSYLRSERVRSSRAHINAARKVRRERFKRSQQKRENKKHEDPNYGDRVPEFQNGGGQPNPEHPGGEENDPNVAGPEPKQTDTNAFRDSQDDEDSEQDTVDDEEEKIRMEAIEASRRKLAGLNLDRGQPSTTRADYEKEERLKREEAERAAVQRREEERRAEEKHRREREEADRAAAEKLKAEKEALRKKQAEIRQRNSARQRLRFEQIRFWSQGFWSNAHAFQRFRTLSEHFDEPEFHTGGLVIFETIPWPVLMRPGNFTLDEINWEAVERFFQHVERMVSPAEYKALVEKTHKRFHPDRWRSRRVLQSVDEEEEKERLGSAANVVAQAMTPIWQKVTGR